MADMPKPPIKNVIMDVRVLQLGRAVDRSRYRIKMAEGEVLEERVDEDNRVCFVIAVSGDDARTLRAALAGTPGVFSVKVRGEAA